MSINHKDSEYKVIEYVIDPGVQFLGPVPTGRLVKKFTGKDAFVRAYQLSQKLNDKQKINDPIIKGYFVKGDLVLHPALLEN
jgi:hypothetical protein